MANTFLRGLAMITDAAHRDLRLACEATTAGSRTVEVQAASTAQASRYGFATKPGYGARVWFGPIAYPPAQVATA